MYRILTLVITLDSKNSQKKISKNEMKIWGGVKIDSASIIDSKYKNLHRI